MEINIDGIDAEKAMDLYDDDMDIFISVLHSYISNIPTSINKLRHVSAETLKDYAVTIHGIKGTSATIGAEKTREAAKKLEALAAAGDLSGVLAFHEAFLKQVDDLVHSIQNWLTQYEAES